MQIKYRVCDLDEIYINQEIKTQFRNKILKLRFLYTF